ncbi:MAG: serine hydrolase [Chitinophagaceae bacterium]
MKNVLFYTLLLLICTSVTAQTGKPVQANDGIATGTLRSVGLDSLKINEMSAKISEGIYPNIHSVLIARNNTLVYEQYWPGKDENWGDSLGVVPHGINDLHDCRSVSKSIVGACIGIAIAQGKIKGVEQRVFDFFPEYKKQDTGLKSNLTIKHLLTMTSGLVWNEDIPYTNPENSEVRMIGSKDPIGFVLSQPMDAVPGKVWKYNGGNTQLLAAIIEKVSGLKIDQFALDYLFKPLGITSYDWNKYPGTSLPAAASGLRLRSRDMLKFGLLYSNSGVWNGRQVVPASWVQESSQFQVARNGQREGGGYGYQFWVFVSQRSLVQLQLVTAVGNGDQRIFMDNDRKLVIVVTAGNYNLWDIKKGSDALLHDYIYPAFR